MSEAHRLAPETEESIQSALEALTRSVQVARVTNDPLLPTLEALAATVRAQHRMFVDASLTIDAAIRDTQRPSELLTTADRKELLRSIGQGVRVAVGDALRLVKPATWITGAVVCFALLGVGFAGGCYWRQRSVDDVTLAMTEQQATFAVLQREAFRDGREAAEQWAAIVAYNHVRDMTSGCRAVVVNGRRRCDVALWLDPELQGKAK